MSSRAADRSPAPAAPPPRPQVEPGSGGEAGRAPTALVRPAVLRLDPYAWEPSSAEIARQQGIPIERVVRFDTNTAPAPPPFVAEVLAEAARAPINEYVDTSYAALTRALARYAGVSTDMVTIGAGADELLDLIAKTFLGPGARALYVAPTYAMHRIVGEILGAESVRVESGPDFRPDRDALLRAARGCNLVWLCNPNNPTGLVEPVEFVADVARRVGCAVAVDEAYFEYCGASAVPLLLDHPNLIVVRTFSKVMGLAGGRIAYALANPELTALVARVRPPNSVALPSLLLAERALADTGWIAERVAATRAERARLQAALEALGCRVIPSVANFLLFRPPVPAAALAAALLRDGLVLRTFGDPRVRDYLRATVRTPAENRRLIAALDSALRTLAAHD